MMKPIDSVYNLIYVLSDIRSFNQGETIKVGRIMLGRSGTYQKVASKDRSTYRQKASGHGFGHRAKKSKNYTKEIRVAEVN